MELKFSKTHFSKETKKVIKKYIKKTGKIIAAASGATIGAVSVALAEPTLTVAEVNTTVLYQVAGVVFTGLAVVSAIIIGVRLYKRL
jgi:hypothetical protein